jgi:hypothetical protein
MAESHGFTVINLYDTFGNEAETLSWDTVHPSAKTIEKAAEVIFQSLTDSQAADISKASK